MTRDTMTKIKMMILIRCLVSAVLLAAPVSAAAGRAEDPRARGIMEKVEARDDGDNIIADQEMILIDKNGHKRVRRMKSFSKDKGRDILKLMFFTSPADVRDTGFLTYDYYSGERDDDQWLYLPELKKVKRIASSDKDSAFMGSDFSYADMTKPVLDEWRYTLVKEVDVRGNPCWIIQALPASKTIEERYGYTKSMLFVRQDIFMVVRSLHWLREGNKVKYQDNVKIENIDGIWVATQINVKSVRNKKVLHRTVFKQRNVRFGQDIDPGLFVTRRLEKGI